MDYKRHDDLFYKHNVCSKSPELNADELFMFFEYILERFSIQLKKDRGDPFPWTEYQILQDNSFTCNRRIDDKTTKWLLNNITNNSSLSDEDKVWKSLIFRTYNKIETAELINLVNATYEELRDKYSFILDEVEGDVFTRAYKNINIKYANKDKYPKHTWKPVALLRILDLRDRYNGSVPAELFSNPEEALEWIINNMSGVGNFIGYQLLLDLMYLECIPYSNNCFVMTGPGSQAGIDRIFIDKDGMSYEDCVCYLTYNFEELCQKGHDKEFQYSLIRHILKDENAYCVSDVQNMLCEFSKFRYLMEGRHLRPRKYIYQGGSQNE